MSDMVMPLHVCALTNALWRTIARASGRTDSCPKPFVALMTTLLEAQEKGSVCTKHNAESLSLQDLESLIQAGVVVRREDVPFDEAKEGPKAPIVFDATNNGEADRYYFRRQFKEEWRLAKRLLDFVNLPALAPTIEQQQKLTSMIRPENPQQGEAIARSLPNRLSIISGGPGTGKTTTVAMLLECLLIAEPEAFVALAAPTGKATSRMKESIANSLKSRSAEFPLLQTALDQNRVAARTIHRWLMTATSQGSQPNARNPIEADILIVDEASMIDSTMALRLFEAVDPNRTRVILLGDRFQLAAVGPGSFFGELTSEDSPLDRCVSRLTKSFRFTSDSMVGRLATHINTIGDSFNWDDFQKVLGTSDKDETRLETDVRFETIKTWLKPYLNEMLHLINELKKANDEEFVSLRAKLWRCGSKFRALCANRQGENSVSAINEWVEKEIRDALKIPQTQPFYPGKMVIIRTNNEDVGLYNGDVGIVVPHPKSPDLLEAIFDEEGENHLSTGLLPQFDTAFAMTIHQSQGSEFDCVAVLLPVDSDSPLNTRELFYTGVTRAKREVFIVGRREAVQNACVRATSRESGLTERILESL